MKIGVMNHPGRDLGLEIAWIGKNGFDFLDLTLEAPETRPERIDSLMVLDRMAEYGLSIVGHTSPFLPFGSPYESVRRSGVEEVIRCLDVFAELRVHHVTMHVDHRRGAESQPANVTANRRSFEEAAREASARGLALMLEHFGEAYSTADSLRAFLDPIPNLGFHLDIGHANLWRSVNGTTELLEAFGDRLRHVHASDNFGGRDDAHLPIGVGNIDWAKAVGDLIRFGYDGTITVEIHSDDRRYLIASRDILRELWQSAIISPEG